LLISTMRPSAGDTTRAIVGHLGAEDREELTDEQREEPEAAPTTTSRWRNRQAGPRRARSARQPALAGDHGCGYGGFTLILVFLQALRALACFIAR